MWSIRMKVFFQAHGYDIFHLVVIGYNSINKTPNIAAKKELKNKKIAMDFIMEGFRDSIKDKVGKCSLAKEL
jgi:hypothetical protein